MWRQRPGIKCGSGVRRGLGGWEGYKIDEGEEADRKAETLGGGYWGRRGNLSGPRTWCHYECQSEVEERRWQGISIGCAQEVGIDLQCVVEASECRDYGAALPSCGLPGLGF